MKELVNYNFKAEDIKDRNYENLFCFRRRDSVFAFALEEEDGSVVAIRDHLGNVPLFYRVHNGHIFCSIFLRDLMQKKDKINTKNLLVYLAYGTLKISSIIEGIKIVPPGTVIKIFPDGNSKIMYSYKFLLSEKLPNFFWGGLLVKMDELMEQAVRRVIVSDTCGLYLSGGIDSALIGIYLKKLGIKINAYTSLPWGLERTEAKYSKINAKVIGVNNHFLLPLKSNRYQDLVNNALKIYGNPHGTLTQLGVIDLWKKTPISEESQVFFGQNADTVTCSVPAQNNIFFASFIPKLLSRFLSSKIGAGDCLQDYLSFTSNARVKYFPIENFQFPQKLSKIQSLTLSGMLVVHTPGDGEVLSLPVIKNKKIFSNPYYDMDLIEFCLNLPFSKRFEFSKESKTVISLQKKIFRALALKYLPRELVFRKKGFTIPIDKDKLTKNFFESLPKEIYSIKLISPKERLAAKILNDFIQCN